MSRPVSLARVLTQTVASDGATGAAFGLLLACAYVAASLDLRQLAESGAPLEHLATLFGAAVAPGVLIAGLAGVYLRRFMAPD